MLSRLFVIIGACLIAVYLFVIGDLASGGHLDRFSAIMYLSQLVVWVGLACFLQAKVTRLERERNRV